MMSDDVTQDGMRLSSGGHKYGANEKERGGLTYDQEMGVQDVKFGFVFLAVVNVSTWVSMTRKAPLTAAELNHIYL